MKNKRVFKIIPVLFIIILFSIVIINIIEKITFDNYIENSIKYFEEINYDTYISLEIKDMTQESKVSYLLKRTKNITNEEYSQYIDDKLLNSISNYYINKNDDLKLYTKNNSDWKEENVEKIDTIFYINYEDLEKKSSNIKYLGNKKIDNKKYIKYSIVMSVYDVYNLVYKEDILSEKDNDNKVKVFVYIDKELGLISKIESNIEDLNNSGNSSALNYEIEIINNDFNNIKAIELPFEI